MKKKILYFIAIFAILLTGCTNKDALKFKEEYEKLNGVTNTSGKAYPFVEMKDENIMRYKTAEEIIDILKNGTGVIYFGFPTCPWCRTMVPILLDAADAASLKEIYYLDIKEIRDTKHLDENGVIVIDKEGTSEYNQIIDILSSNLTSYSGLNDETIKRLYAPTVVFVKDGKVLGVHIATLDSQTDPYEKLTTEQYNELKSIYYNYINSVIAEKCDTNC